MAHQEFCEALNIKKQEEMDEVLNELKEDMIEETFQDFFKLCEGVNFEVELEETVSREKSYRELCEGVNFDEELEENEGQVKTPLTHIAEDISDDEEELIQEKSPLTHVLEDISDVEEDKVSDPVEIVMEIQDDAVPSTSYGNDMLIDHEEIFPIQTMVSCFKIYSG